VKVDTAANAIKARAEGREAKKEKAAAQRDKKAETKLLRALDKLDPERQGVSKRKVRIKSGLNPDPMDAALMRLVEDGVVVTYVGTTTSGKGRQQQAEMVKRVGGIGGCVPPKATSNSLAEHGGLYSKPPCSGKRGRVKKSPANVPPKTVPPNLPF